MKKSSSFLFILGGLFFITSLIVSSSSEAALELYRGQSDIGDEETGRSCLLTLDRDEKSNEIVSMKLEAPARLQKPEQNTEEESVEITTGKEGRDLSRTKIFSEYRFQKMVDLQGDGFMLRGEKIRKSKKDEKLFIHFDIREGTPTGVQFAQREKLVTVKNKFAGDRVLLEKSCSGLKKQ